MRNFICEPLTRDQVKELYFVIHNGKTEEERKQAINKLVYSYSRKVHSDCLNIVQNMYYCEYLNEEQEDQLHDLEQIAFEVLRQKTKIYDPNHSSGANLYTFAADAIKNAILKETNKGMTSTEIKHYNNICEGIEYYEEKFKTPWYETEDSLNKLSDITGYSVKVLKKAFEAKRETSIETIPLDTPMNNEEDFFLEDTIGNEYYSFETEFRNNEARLFIKSLSKLEKDILFTMVDIHNDYKLISEREGVRRLEKMGYTFGRGTLNSRREALKRKVYAFLNDPEYVVAA